MTPGTRRAVWWLIALAFVLRVCVRLYMGGEGYFQSGYSMFFEMAKSIAAGKGIGFGDGQPETFRVPLYSLLLAAVTMGRELFLVVLMVHSMIGAATVWCAARLAGLLFNESLFNDAAAITAAAITAMYPYYVIHDTALQETSLYTLLTVVSVLLLLQARRTGSGWWAAGAGLALGADVMTRVTIVPFAILAVMWLFWTWRGNALLCAAVAAVVIAPWLIRSYRITGSPTLSTESGFEVWNGNNAQTFRHYPLGSIDESRTAAFEALTPGELSELEVLDSDEAGRERWFLHKGLAYMHEHPWRTVENGFRKLGAAFGWLPSPRRGRLRSLMHAVSYGPVMLLGLWGMWLRRRHWREDAIFYAAFVSFAVVTAVIFGHTSHRVYLDIYWIVFAAGTVESWRRRLVT